MDRYYFAKLVARERKNEINNDLAIRHMLKEAEGDMPRMTRSKRMVLRFAPIVIIIALLVFYFIG